MINLNVVMITAIHCVSPLVFTGDSKDITRIDEILMFMEEISVGGGAAPADIAKEAASTTKMDEPAMSTSAAAQAPAQGNSGPN